MKKLIKIFRVCIIVTIIALMGVRFLSQRKIDQLETQNITRISTRYFDDVVVVELSPNYNLMDVDNKMYYTKLSSFDELETLRSLLGVYYSFDQ
ncbi:hypothetical protein PT129_08205 [Erysipelothrix rhusiopathiae]|uniref:hypothetical protein n=1 Tax=Erysipelothrix rhusiopathiae TaxID=1648 RepID=UPI0020B127DC|nr:hypothetical protein [Erysipelothrix rhusiopathiae]MDE8082590.1 hypothetical protein [Erysipelothrix rhusiopathiae]MDE8228228.1 hypothetical protein [Erysipelothrix rhusiopathiae]